MVSYEDVSIDLENSIRHIKTVGTCPVCGYDLEEQHDMLTNTNRKFLHCISCDVNWPHPDEL